MANQEQLDLLTQGVEKWNQWKTATQEVAPGRKWNLDYDAELSQANLSGINLNGINFGLVDLSSTNFTEAQLVGANLAEAELAEAIFVGANLAGTNLTDANLCDTNFSHADLRSAHLCYADLSGACLRGANLSGADLRGANLENVCLEEANLHGANLSGASYGTAFPRAKMRQAKEAGAVVKPMKTSSWGAHRRDPWFRLKKQQENQDILLYPRVAGRLLSLLGASLLFVLAGFWMLLSNAGNPVQAVVAILVIGFFGLGAVVLFFNWLRLLLRPFPLLALNDEEIAYAFSSLLGRMEQKPMTRRNCTLAWKEIGALGCIKQRQTPVFVIYASAKRWRSGWWPSIQIPESLLPLSAERLTALIHQQYQTQIEAYRITLLKKEGEAASVH